MAESNLSMMPKSDTFSNIMVLPNLSRKGSIFGGGPDWPNWDAQIWPRHCRNNRPVDTAPENATEEPETVSEHLYWAGHAHSHFGHLLAEYSTRILPSLKNDTTAKFLFGVMPEHRGNLTWASAPRFFKEILDWYNVAESNVLFCHKPLLVETLTVAPQGEQMGKIAPFDDYLDMLDENTARNKLKPQRTEILYVSRSRLPAYLGGHAGASYLDEVLEKSGVEIIFPEIMPLRRQLEYYQGADKIVFPEGSAIHGAQLLGRGLGEIYVVNRRIGRNNHHHDIAGAQIKPRSELVKSFEPLNSLLGLYRPNGDVQVGLGIAIFDTDKLLENFDSFGAGLSRHWQTKSYEIRRDADILVWLENIWHRSRRHIKRMDQDKFLGDLASAGLGHLVGAATKILDG